MSTYSPTYSANPIYDTITALSNVTAGKIILNGITTNTYSNPIVSDGDFLGINVNNVRRYIKIYKQVIQIPSVIGKYWYSPESTSWYILSNWYSDINHTLSATDLPNSSTDVIILSTVAPFINLDSPSWVQPNSINTGTTTVTFSSQLSANVTCTITGSAVFLGNSTFNI